MRLSAASQGARFYTQPALHLERAQLCDAGVCIFCPDFVTFCVFETLVSECVWVLLEIDNAVSGAEGARARKLLSEEETAVGVVRRTAL